MRGRQRSSTTRSGSTGAGGAVGTLVGIVVGTTVSNVVGLAEGSGSAVDVEVGVGGMGVAVRGLTSYLMVSLGREPSAGWSAENMTRWAGQRSSKLFIISPRLLSGSRSQPCTSSV